MPTSITIQDLQTGSVFKLPYVPNSLKISDTANFASIGIIGENNVRQQFVNGSRTASFDIDLPALYSEAIDDVFGEATITATRFLQSLVKVDSQRGYPPIKIQWASMLDIERWIVSSIETTHTNFFEFLEYAPAQSNVSISLIEQPLEFRDRQSYAGNYQNLTLRGLNN